MNAIDVSRWGDPDFHQLEPTHELVATGDGTVPSRTSAEAPALTRLKSVLERMLKHCARDGRTVQDSVGVFDDSFRLKRRGKGEPDVTSSDCGSGSRGFEPRHRPHLTPDRHIAASIARGYYCAQRSRVQIVMLEGL